jgi:putative hydrolase
VVENRSEPTASEAAQLDNSQIAHRLEEVAELLEIQRTNPFRVRAYREAGRQLRTLVTPVRTILETEGIAGLERLPGIGHSLARSISQLARGGRLGFLEHLRGEAEPEQLLATIPGIGPELACRIHQLLGVETLEDLEVAAHDGRLSQVPGMGQKRLAGIRDALAGRLRRLTPPPLPHAVPSFEPRPLVEEILDIDREYREAVAAGRLPLIAPRRFNPSGKAWLPILHTERGTRHYTALYSNTARAHELGMEHDWVVIYRDDHGGNGQWTVVTAKFGPARGERIIRGREVECAAHYRKLADEARPLFRNE